MEKIERIQTTLAGDNPDRVPVMLWRHWPGDDQRTVDLARSIIDFQFQYDWDVICLATTSNYPVMDYGIFDTWDGDALGQRTITKSPVQTSLDWTNLRPLEPSRGSQGRQLEVLRRVSAAYREQGTPIIVPVYSPVDQAICLAGKSQFIHHMRTEPDRVRSGLNALTESTLRFLSALVEYDIAGIYYIVHADLRMMSVPEYVDFGKPYDRKVLEGLSANWWLNLVQLEGDYPMLNLFFEYPIQGLGWNTETSGIDLAEGKLRFRNAVVGGLRRWEDMVQGTPSAIGQRLRDMIDMTANRRHILSCNGNIPITTPLSNIRAIRDNFKKG